MKKTRSPKTKAVAGFQVGKAYLIRTVTMTWTGRVVAISPGFLRLAEAAWVADTGRYSESVAKGVSGLSEVEPVEDALVNVATIVDAVPWNHPLPREVK